MKTKIFNFYADPGHGWLAVNKSDLKKLGIETQISSYSYQCGEMVFLEEDCDASRFLAVLKASGIDPIFRTHHTNRQSRIRGYETYCPEVGTLTESAAEG